MWNIPGFCFWICSNRSFYHFRTNGHSWFKEFRSLLNIILWTSTTTTIWWITDKFEILDDFCFDFAIRVYDTYFDKSTGRFGDACQKPPWCRSFRINTHYVGIFIKAKPIRLGFESERIGIFAEWVAILTEVKWTIRVAFENLSACPCSNCCRHWFEMI